MVSASIDPPREVHALATWFAEAVRVELAELAKKGGEQRYELHSGKRLSAERLPYAIYRFLLADSTLVPEDASGTIEVEGCQFKASVIAQETNRVDVQIDDAGELGTFVPRAILCVDDLGLLRKLAEILEAVASGTEPVSPLTTAIFHPKSDGAFKLSLPGMAALDRVTGEQRVVIEQACASEITFVWGPPGTGKTYVIAHLIAALVARGERVLMASHTRAAVDQSIYETVKHDPDPDKSGPLADSDLVHEGKIVRIGRVPPDPKVPESVRLDNIVESKTERIQSEISQLQRKAEPLSTKRAHLKAQLAEWERLSQLRQRLLEAERRVSEAGALVKRRLAEHTQARRQVEDCKNQVQEASQAWFFRARKIAQASETLMTAERSHSKASIAVEEASASARTAEGSVESLRVQTKTQTDTCAQFSAAEILREQLVKVDAELDPLERRLTELSARLDALQKEVITNARVVAATLTKCYVGNDLDGQSFDALIVDEISMALPPLLFVAARRASRRVILVGDFKQLPPIVRADTDVTDKRLGTDAFLLAGMADNDLEPTNHPALTHLCMQRRMLPQIAEAARCLSYGPENLVDHDEVLRRTQPDWLGFLPTSALVIVDTADLHCWSGRQAGSLSRFNLYSGQVAVELAAMAAAAIPRPGRNVARQIGIVTPYAAQARLLLRLVEALELDDWVKVGTVHTFQGGEAELVIFDSVLDEPYWTARLCNPNDAMEVRRDLNVALTRAKSKFILVGSSEWLNHHAKQTSGLGELWRYMIKHADLVSAHQLVEAGFATRVAGASTDVYRIPATSSGAVLERLDESTFFDRFAADLRDAKKSIFVHVAFFGTYRWPKMEPLFRAAIERDVQVTFITPSPAEAENKGYVEKVIHSLRQLGAVVVAATGLHGKDVIIDANILYTGSLNAASHRGTQEDVHRIESPEYVKTCLEYMQAGCIRNAAQQGNQARTCPNGRLLQVVNIRQMRPWDKQPMKIGCMDYKECGCKYLVDIDQRPPFLRPPLCSIDQRTKYRRVKRGRGETWECPKHPKECERFKVVRGDLGDLHGPDGRSEDGQAELSLFYP